MAKAEENHFYSERLLTLNPRSTDEYVKTIYDDWAETYDKVLCRFHDLLPTQRSNVCACAIVVMSR